MENVKYLFENVFWLLYNMDINKRIVKNIIIIILYRMERSGIK